MCECEYCRKYTEDDCPLDLIDVETELKGRFELIVRPITYKEKPKYVDTNVFCKTVVRIEGDKLCLDIWDNTDGVSEDVVDVAKCEVDPCEVIKDGLGGHVLMKINYCPMCGRKLASLK